MTNLTAALAVTVALWTVPTSEPHLDGLATYYSPGLMEQVAVNRGMDLTGYHSGVALNRAGDLRRTVWLTWPDGQVTGPHLVIDCAQRNHYATRESQRRIVEVAAELAQEIGFYRVGPHPVRVLFRQPPLTHEPLPDVMDVHTSKDKR